MLEAGYENLLAELFGLNVDSAISDVPTGAILARNISANTFPESHHWLRAVPVNLVPDRDRLVLRKSEAAGKASESLQRQVADQILNNFSDLFVEIILDNVSGWLVRLKQPARITTVNTDTVSGKNIAGFLPAGAQAAKWIAVFNEIQMILHAADSAEHGFNALWFEGAGPLPAPAPARKLATIGEDGLFQAFAGYCQAEQYEGLMNIMDRLAGLESLIVCDVEILEAFNRQSEKRLRHAMQSADQQLSQVLSLLDAGHLSQVYLYLLNDRKYSIGKAGMLELFKRKKTFAELFETKHSRI